MIAIEEVSIGFAGPQLLESVSARIEIGQRIGLLGRNGAGKTTLLRMLSGQIQPDNGTINVRQGVQVARLTQDVPTDLSELGELPGGDAHSVRSVVLAGQIGKQGVDDSWAIEHAVDTTLSQMNLDPDAIFESLSSGMKRRVLLARSISTSPDVLLLDEPTNHLDIPSILWLEDFLSRWDKTLVFITHDRSFLQKLATRIWEIDRGRLFDWSCDYETFLKRKQQTLEAEEKQNALFDKRLAEEERWIRTGIKARRTRNEGRVRALKEMRNQRAQRRTQEGTAKLNLQTAARSGALVAEVESISFAYGDTPIVTDFSTTLMRGDKIGIIGPNGAGKTTLLKLLLGQLKPDSGKVRLGTNLKVTYFDQLRDTLDPELTVHENVGEGSERLQIGDTTQHIMGYLQDYLFTPERARTKVKFLSGGEKNRALLAKLMTKPANVIVLDEPTNDLDAETLELLEEQLAEYNGTLLMVSHDRTFLNNVVTSTIVFEADGPREYVGGYDDWRAAVARRESAGGDGGKSKAAAKKSADSPATSAPAVTPTVAAKKLSYKEKRELEQLPVLIEQLESKIAEMHDAMAAADYYQRDGELIAKDAAELKQAESDLETAYSRWELLEG
ncbi:ATP-binding cassette domain-containing protein [Stieleria varia]|uniref:ATP-binding cassette domain-containing protein n=1 Tax=Stieleria varia TaxID=2528005 RepID=UPI0011B64B36|nr:ATP-binding cassette domain-containing protein [Stieleria varia]